MRIFRSIHIAAVFISLAACAQQPPASSAHPAADDSRGTGIVIENTVHFMAPDGSEIVVPPGRYDVESPAEAQLRLVPDSGGESRLVAAASRRYDLDYSKPIAVSMPYEDGMHHVMLLLPGGTVLDAVGSPSGVATRGLPPLPKSVFAEALSAKVNTLSGSTQFVPGDVPPFKLRIPVKLTIQPSPQVSNFQDCGVALAGGYVKTVVAKWVIMGQPYK